MKFKTLLTITVALVPAYMVAFIIHVFIKSSEGDSMAATAVVMRIGFYDGCMEAKSKHNKNIGVIHNEEQKCKVGSEKYEEQIRKEIEEGYSHYY